EGVNLLRVFGEGFGGRELHRIEPRPETALVAERAQPAFGGNARACEHYDSHVESSVRTGGGPKMPTPGSRFLRSASRSEDPRAPSDAFIMSGFDMSP